MFVVMMTLFAIVLVGYGAGKLGYLGGDFDRQLSRLVTDSVVGYDRRTA